jgi:hypothetical protein
VKEITYVSLGEVDKEDKKNKDVVEGSPPEYYCHLHNIEPGTYPIDPDKKLDTSFDPNAEEEVTPPAGEPEAPVAPIVPEEPVTPVEPVAPTTYTVTVSGGTGGGNYEPGATVSITANPPAAGKVFAGWSGNVVFANAAAASTTFVMPATNVTVTPSYKDEMPAPAPTPPPSGTMGAIVSAQLRYSLWSFTDLNCGLIAKYM